MIDRLSSVDASSFYLEDPAAPMHVGGVTIFRESEAGFDYDRLVKLITERIASRSAIPPTGQAGARQPGESGLGGRSQVRRDVSRAPLCLAAAWH